ncbi:MAG TPA: metallophosphoesterase family protein, partial [Bacilli bacterium]|nr:metallophosphoesterase family protein [Bacilli bacterium]
MKRKSILSLLIVFLLFTSFVFLKDSKVKAATASDVFLLITNPGEDMSTQMNVNYHTDIAGTYVELALKSAGNFNNATKVYGECAAPKYGFEGTNFGIDWGIGKSESKFVCEVYLKDLTPGTEYMYKAGKTNMSEPYYFKTAGHDENFAFAVMADPQIYAIGQQANVNANMNSAMQIAGTLGWELELVLGAGDMVNQGGIMDNWRMLYDLDIYKEMPLAGSTGNHDYCDGGNAKVPTSSITDHVYNNPKNSYAGKTEGMYWFKRDSALFIVMDSEDIAAYDKQITWFIDICENVPHQYLFVMAHRPPWGSTDSDGVAAKWVPVFNKYNLDMYFGGHNHDYGRGSIKEGPARGQAKFSNRYVCADDTYNASNAEANKGGYCLINITPTGFYFRAYDQFGTCRDQAVYPAQRTNAPATTFTKSSFMNTIKAEVVDTNTTKATLSWGAEGYGHINYVTLSKTDNTVVKNVFADSDISTSFEFTGLKA